MRPLHLGRLQITPCCRLSRLRRVKRLFISSLAKYGPVLYGKVLKWSADVTGARVEYRRRATNGATEALNRQLSCVSQRIQRVPKDRKPRRKRYHIDGGHGRSFVSKEHRNCLTPQLFLDLAN